MTAKTDAQIEDTEVAPAEKPETPGARLAARKAAKAARKAAERGKSNVVTDAVQEQALSAGSWLSDNGRVISIGLGAIALGLAVFAGVRMMGEQKAQEAAVSLAKGVKSGLASVVSGDAPEETEDSDEETYATLDARATKALAGYQEVTSKHAGTEAALWARLGEGNELLTLGKAEEAGRAFGAVASETEDDYLRYRALEGHGFALEAQNKLDDATQKFGEIAKLANGGYKPASDYHLARLLALRGDTKSAKELYGKLIDALGEQALEKGERFTAIRDEAQIRLSELGGERKTRPNAAGAGVGAEGLTPELLETLRKQLDLKGQ